MTLKDIKKQTIIAIFFMMRVYSLFFSLKVKVKIIIVIKAIRYKI